MSVSLLTLRNKAKQRSDMENSAFVSDAEWNSYINESAAELYDILVATYEDYYYTTSTITTVAGTKEYNLPADFYHLKGVDWLITGTDYVPILKFNFKKRNRNRVSLTTYTNRYAPFKYRVMGQKLVLDSDPGAGTIKLWYVPLYTELSVDADEFDDQNAWGEYIVVSAAIKALSKEESDTTELRNQLAGIYQRIKTVGMNRDEGEPGSVTDVNDYASGYLYDDEWGD